MATAVEKFESRAGDASEWTLVYTVSGSDDTTELLDAVYAAAPATYRGNYRRPAQLEPVGHQLWQATVKYIPNEWDAPQTGESSFAFDTSGGTQHLTQSRQTIQRYAPAGQTAPDFKGAIGVTHDSVEGVDITVPAFSFTVTRYVANEHMTQTYIEALYALTGKVNNAAWSLNVDGVQISFAAGEVLLLGVSGTKRQRERDWEISFRFAASPNASGLVVGDITGIAKKGWEYLWVRYADVVDPAAKTVVKRPIAAYVEQVYPTGNFALLGIS